MPRAGEYNCRVEIQEKTTEREDSGAEVPEWHTTARRWAAIEPIGGNEVLNAQQVQGVGTHQIRMPWWDGLTVAHRIKFHTRIFDINSAENRDTRRIEWFVRATEAPAETT